MILEETEAIERFESPLNLLNRLKSELRTPHRNASSANIVSQVLTSTDIIPNLDEKLSQGSLKSKAASIMNSALDELQIKLVDIQRPKELANIVESMSRVITAQNEKIEADNRPQILIYAPSQVSEEHFETIYVKE